MYILADDSRADRRGTDDTPYEGLVYTANNRDREKQPHLQYRQLSGKSNRPDRQKGVTGDTIINGTATRPT